MTVGSLCSHWQADARIKVLTARDPGRDAAEVKDAYRKIFDTENLSTPRGLRLVEITDASIDSSAGRYRGMCPAAAKILTVGETSCLTLVWAVLNRASRAAQSRLPTQ